MKSDLSILAYDDSDSGKEQIEAKCKEGLRGSKAQISALTSTEFTDLLDGLAGREKKIKPTPTQKEILERVDSADIFVLDFDLRYVPERPLLGAERVSYFLRCYSSVKAIVAVNPLPSRTFDLRLRAAPDGSWSDVGVYTHDLANRALWHGKVGENSYRPWSWPKLLDVPSRLAKMCKDAAEHWETPLFEFFDVPDAEQKNFPKDLTNAAVANPKTSTFKTIARGRLRTEDRRIDEEALARVAASAVSSWLENIVLPGQHVLVDAPHLALQFPSLLKGTSRSASVWNKSANLELSPTTYFHTDRVASHRFARAHWLSRPTWWSRSVMNEPKISEVGKPWSFEAPDLVFAEDTSSFATKASCRPFSLPGTSPYSRRYVERPKVTPSVDYAPAMLLALAQVD